MSSKKKSRVADSSSSESDSGPEDRNPPKKAKQDKKAGKSRNDEDEDTSMFPLSRNRFVNVREFRGKVLIDIREFYDANGDLKPGKKGICLTVEQWNALKSKVDSIDEAVKRF